MSQDAQIVLNIPLSDQTNYLISTLFCPGFVNKNVKWLSYKKGDSFIVFFYAIQGDVRIAVH